MRIIQNPQIQNAQLLIVKAAGTHSYHWALKGSVKLTFLAIAQNWGKKDVTAI
jgi:hypothetical protein